MTDLKRDVLSSYPYIRISPYKLRRVADLVRRKSVSESLAILRNIPHKGSRIIFKVLMSGIANAKHNFSLDEKSLYISEILVDEAPKLKRFQPKGRGRIYQILKRSSHLKIKLGVR